MVFAHHKPNQGSAHNLTGGVQARLDDVIAVTAITIAGAAVVTQGIRWVSRQEQPLKEMARGRYEKARAAGTAATNAWHKSGSSPESGDTPLVTTGD